MINIRIDMEYFTMELLKKFICKFNVKESLINYLIDTFILLNLNEKIILFYL